MFNFVRYYGSQLFIGVGNLLNDLLLFLNSQIEPRYKKELPLNGDNQSFNDLDMSSLISEDESQINESNLEVNPIHDTPDNINNCSPRTTRDSSDCELHNLDESLKCLQFNDTLDEVEFMMKQGLQILSNSGRNSATPNSTKRTLSTAPNNDYVKSPISMYIKYSPMTLSRRNNSNMHQRVCIETHRESSIICEDDNEQSKMLVEENSAIFPRRAYKNAEHNQIIYKNVTHRIDGTSKQKSFGKLKASPTINNQYGRLKTKALSHRKENIPIDGSFNNFSMDCGDISLHVVKRAYSY